MPKDAMLKFIPPERRIMDYGEHGIKRITVWDLKHIQEVVIRHGLVAHFNHQLATADFGGDTVVVHLMGNHTFLLIVGCLSLYCWLLVIRCVLCTLVFHDCCGFGMPRIC